MLYFDYCRRKCRSTVWKILQKTCLSYLSDDMWKKINVTFFDVSNGKCTVGNHRAVLIKDAQEAVIKRRKMTQERYCNIINASDFVLIAKTSIVITEYLEVVTRKSQGHSSHAKKIILVYICQTSYRGSDISRKTYIYMYPQGIYYTYKICMHSLSSQMLYPLE